MENDELFGCKLQSWTRQMHNMLTETSSSFNQPFMVYSCQGHDVARCPQTNTEVLSAVSVIIFLYSMLFSE